jgi:DNA polymerase III delta prime subunit
VSGTPSLASELALARSGRLYPSVILHGGDPAARREGALALARVLLCEGRPGEAGCARRIAWPGENDKRFHPDFHVLERDTKIATSVEATREFLKEAHLAPFEAGAQVFVIASAETLSQDSANVLLKALEEPHLRAPRNFLLLAPSALDLLPTLRSRSLAVYLGPSSRPDPAAAERLTGKLVAALDAWRSGRSTADLLVAAAALEEAGGPEGAGWRDLRATEPWTLAATAVLAVAKAAREPAERRALLALAEDLLAALPWRLRAISPQRILEGLVFRRLAG